MSEAKFSPAPWYCEKTTIYKLGKGGTNEFWCHLQAAGKEKVPEEELMANANLIAAAPDLYEELEGIYTNLAMAGGVLTLDEDHFTSIGKLLSKARGE